MSLRLIWQIIYKNIDKKRILASIEILNNKTESSLFVKRLRNIHSRKKKEVTKLVFVVHFKLKVG
jgi:hypothetical protein